MSVSLCFRSSDIFASIYNFEQWNFTNSNNVQRYRATSLYFCILLWSGKLLVEETIFEHLSICQPCLCNQIIKIKVAKVSIQAICTVVVECNMRLVLKLTNYCILNMIISQKFILWLVFVPNSATPTIFSVGDLLFKQDVPYWLFVYWTL